tara:strand:- start:969 stop:1295 length:327 start_codon:yes stop_codon:yes gene_type:complete
MSNKKRYYPNNWRAIKNAPWEAFDRLAFDDFMDWKIQGWRIPDAVLCIIREEDPKTGKVREFTYKREHAAKKKTHEIMDAGNHFVICTANELNTFKPEEDWEDDSYDE